MARSYRELFGFVLGFAGLALSSGCTTEPTSSGPSTLCTPGQPGCAPLPATQLPCDVQTLLVERCGACHGNPLVGGAPMPLLTWEDMQAPAGKSTLVDSTGLKVFESVLQRVTHADQPMPPVPYAKLTAEELATLQNWANAGAGPRTSTDTCSSDDQVLPPPDGDSDGSSGDGSGDGISGDGNGDGSAGDGGVVQGGGPEDCVTYYELRAHGGSGENDSTPFMARGDGSNQGNQYHCFYFDPPYNAEDEGLWFQPIIDNGPILHHWLLYANDHTTGTHGTSAPCAAAEPGSYLLAGWAPGAPESSLPDDVSIQMPYTPGSGLILEMHYFNTTGEAKPDRSGVKFCTAPKGTREHLAAVHFTGGENICIQPGAKPDDVNPYQGDFGASGAKTRGTCDPADDQDIHLLNIWPHMHMSGRHMKVTINRANGTKEVIHDAPFDFNLQITYPLDDIVLKPGDTMDTECWYENETNAAIPFGENSQREMCYGFVTAWPAGSLVYSGSAISPLGFTQPANRCLDPLSILGSCNGLDDWPIIPQ